MDVKIVPGIEDESLFYWIYDLDVPIKPDKKIVFGTNNPKVCRFCTKTSETTTFKKKAHLIPELMGNKLFFSNYECDECNTLFSKYEDSFANFGGIFNTISMLKGKRGVPKHKHPHEGFEVLASDGKLNIRLNASQKVNKELEESLLTKFDSVQIDEQKGRIHINTIKHTYIPKYAFKLLAKIGLSLLKSSDINNFDRAINWLITPYHEFDKLKNPLFHIYKRIQPKNFPQPWGVLFKKRSELLNYPSPEKVLLLFFGNYAYQIFLPFNNLDNWIWSQKELVLPIENHLVILDGTSHDHRFQTIDLNSNEKRKGEKDSFSLGIERI